MNRIYTWLRRRKLSFGTEVFSRQTGRTLRTVETVEVQERTILLGGIPAEGSDSCPLCGNRLDQTLEEPAHLPLLE